MTFRKTEFSYEVLNMLCVSGSSENINAEVKLLLYRPRRQIYVRKSVLCWQEYNKRYQWSVCSGPYVFIEGVEGYEAHMVPGGTAFTDSVAFLFGILECS